MRILGPKTDKPHITRYGGYWLCAALVNNYGITHFVSANGDTPRRAWESLTYSKHKARAQAEKEFDRRLMTYPEHMVGEMGRIA